MQVRPGDAAGGADLADRRARLDNRVARGIDRAQMRVQRQQSLAMVDDHLVAGEEVVARVEHGAAGRGQHRRAGRCRDVHAAVRIARAAVEEPPQAERAGARSRRRRLHRGGARRVVAESAQDRGEVRALALVARQVVRRKFDLARRNLQVLLRVVLPADLDRARLDAAIGAKHLDRHARTGSG
jgi:hypothetical protein